MASIDRRPNGRWRARYRTPDGRSRGRVFDRKIDAERFLTSMEHSKLTGSYVDPRAGRVTVREYWPTWSARQQWRDSSRSSITSLFSVHVLPLLGDRPLNSITKGDVEAWSAALPLAGQTKRQAAQYLSRMLEGAVDDELISKNPAHRARRPKVETEPVVPFTSEEKSALEEAAPAPFRVALTLGLGAGLRLSEATGLTLDRVDFLRRQLVVDRQLVSPSAGVPTFGPLKTKRSYRTVPLADAVVDALARHIEEHGTGQDGLLLRLDDDGPMRRQRFGVIWRALRKKAELPEAKFHTTRHTFASTLLSAGVPVPAVAEYLGHSPAVLLSTYAHLMPADHDRARSAVQAAFDAEAGSLDAPVIIGAR